MRYKLLAGIVLILVGLFWFLPVTPPQVAEELPLNLRRLSDRALIAWVGNHMQTIDIVSLRTARGLVVIEISQDIVERAEDVAPPRGEDRRRQKAVHDRQGFRLLQRQAARRRRDEHPREQHRGDLGKGGRRLKEKLQVALEALGKRFVLTVEDTA